MARLLTKIRDEVLEYRGPPRRWRQLHPLAGVVATDEAEQNTWTPIGRAVVEGRPRGPCVRHRLTA